MFPPPAFAVVVFGAGDAAGLFTATFGNVAVLGPMDDEDF